MTTTLPTTTTALQKEFAAEAQTTRTFLERLPYDKLDWQPHPKSMTLKQLAVHLAELPSWVRIALTTDGIDFEGNDFSPSPVASKHELLELFDTNLAAGQAELAIATPETMREPWVMRMGSKVLAEDSKAEIIRIGMSQTVHHRAQLGVYFRLLDIPVPKSYGPTADDNSF